VITGFVAALVISAPSLTQAQPPTLDGRWKLSLVLDSAWRTPQRPSARTLAGELLVDPVEPRPAGGVELPTVHTGSFVVDFRRFGFVVYGATLFASAYATDSVRIVLNPTVDHGHVQLTGRLRKNRIEGAWILVGDPMGARGSFVLERLSETARRVEQRPPASTAQYCNRIDS